MPQHILALDIGGRHIRAATVETTFRDYRVTGLYEEDGDASAPLAERLRTFLSKHQLEPDTVLVTMPSERATQRTLAMPFRDRKRLNQTVPFELETYVPFGLDEIVVDYQILQRQRTGCTVLAAMVPKRELRDHLAVLSEAGIDPKVVDFAPLCGLNLLIAVAQDLPETFAFVEVTQWDVSLALYRNKALIGVRSILPSHHAATAANGSAPPPHSSPEGIAREVRWSLMVLNDGPLDRDFPCILAGEPSEHLTEVARALAETAGLQVTRLESMQQRSLPGVSNGQAPAFTRPLGLALREVAPANTMGINFRRGEFTYHQGQMEMRRSLIRIGALAAVVVALVMTNLFVSYRLQQTRVEKIEEQIRRIYAETVPGVPLSGSATAQLQTQIETLQRKLGLLVNAAPVGNLTAIDLLRALAAAVPPQVRIDTEEYTMDTDAVRIRGRTESFESVDALKKQLANIPYFRDIQVKDSKQGADGKGVDFRLNLTLNKPGQESES